MLYAEGSCQNRDKKNFAVPEMCIYVLYVYMNIYNYLEELI